MDMMIRHTFICNHLLYRINVWGVHYYESLEARTYLSARTAVLT